MNYKIGFLGPEGTFTQQAAQQLVPKECCTLLPYPSIADVLLSADQGEIDGAVVPIENSIEGSVNLTVDFLANQVDLGIVKEVVVPISHSLLVSPGTKLHQIRKIFSHPQALAQCHQYMREYFPHIETESVNSTAKAAQMVQEAGSHEFAAIGTVLAADIYDLTILAANIQDRTNNNTRFVFAAKNWRDLLEFVKTETEPWKIATMITLGKDYPGALYEVLRSFAQEEINLTKIESRPTKRQLGTYYFLIDFYGELHDPRVQRAFAGIEKTGSALRILGNYQLLTFSPIKKAGVTEHTR